MSKRKPTLKRDPVRRGFVPNAMQSAGPDMDKAWNPVSQEYSKKKLFTQQDLDEALHKARPKPNTLEEIFQKKELIKELEDNLEATKRRVLEIEDVLKEQQSETAKLKERLIVELRQ